nr:SulP family inorganic anion transporter [Candidatus Krumholzibacteria bacterium]
MNTTSSGTANLNSRAGLKALLGQESAYLIRPWTLLKNYRKADLRPDLVAGLTVAVVLLPQAIAYALIAELPAQMGLYSAIVAAVIGGLWGSSRHLHTGPTNATSLLILATLLTVTQPGTPEFLAAAGLLAVMVGIMKLAMGLLRMGVLVNFVADSVVLGFTAGAGVLISVNQLRHLLRVDIASSPDILTTLRDLIYHVGDIHLISLGLGLGTMLVIGLLRRFKPDWPAALLGMIGASAVTGFFQLDDQGVRVLGALPQSLPPFSGIALPTPGLLGHLSAGALAVSAIGLVEAVSSARNIASKSGQRLDSNQEFVGQGLSSIVCGLFSGFAVSGSFTRSAINFTAGGRTPLASVFSGAWVMAAMFLLAPLAVYLPRTALAGVLLVTAFGMADRREMRKVLRTSVGDSSILVATFLATLLLPLEFAVLAGMLVSFARYLIKTSTPGVYPVVPDENFRHFVNVEDSAMCPQLGVMNIEGSLYFGAVNHVEEAIRTNQEENPRQKFLLLRMYMVDHCDVSGIHMLESIVQRYRKLGGDVYMEGVRPRVLHMIALYGFDRVLGHDHLLQNENAISHLFHKVLNPGFCVYECPHRVFAECQALPKDSHAGEFQFITETPDHHIEELSPTVLKLLTEDPDEKLLLIDVREKGEFRNWHIRGARQIPLRRLGQEGPDLPSDHSLVFVSRIGRRSEMAVHIMQDLGHLRAFNLKGGILAWEAAGYPIAVE